MSKEKETLENVEKNSIIVKKENQSLVKKEKNNKLEKVPNKSIQNKVIVNIKSFITKIIEMQEKVKEDEEELKKQAEDEKVEIEKEKESLEIENQKRNYLLEYYDLPYRYNETTIKILAQTPKRLFVYWDISDQDTNMLLDTFGKEFFDNTYPVLLLHNETRNYTTEVSINDFANSWYLDINDPRDKYTIQLGRKFKFTAQPEIKNNGLQNNPSYIHLENDFLFIATSNKLEVPNDHILFEEFKPYVKYRNVKTNEEVTIKVFKTSYKNMLKELYGKLYNNVQFEHDEFDMLNPSSNGVGSSNNTKWSY